MLCALGLALAPVTASAAVAQTNGMPGCTMDGKMPSKSVDHAKMDCCTPACQAPSSAALLSDGMAAPSIPSGNAELSWAPAKELASFTASGLDPPPRA